MRIGFLALPEPSHMGRHLAVAKALISAGHEALVLSANQAAPLAAAAGVPFAGWGRLDHDGREMLRQRSVAMQVFAKRAILVASTGLEQARAARLDALVVDGMEFTGSTVAEILGVPFASLASALPIRRDPGLPPWQTGRAFPRSRPGRWLDAIENRITDHLFLAPVNRERRRLGLAPYRQVDQTLSSRLDLWQLPAELDYPRPAHPVVLRTGPIAMPATPKDFPWSRLDGRPLIYASLGTLCGSDVRQWRQIAVACSGLGAQLVIGLGHCLAPAALGDLPGDPVVVADAPQRDLLARSRLAILHGGLNGVLEAISAGVPIVAMPCGGDQPGIARRLVWRGVGEMVLGPGRLRPAVRRLLNDDRYRQRARTIAAAMAGRVDGSQCAAAACVRAFTPEITR